MHASTLEQTADTGRINIYPRVIKGKCVIQVCLIPYKSENDMIDSFASARIQSSSIPTHRSGLEMAIEAHLEFNLKKLQDFEYLLSKRQRRLYASLNYRIYCRYCIEILQAGGERRVTLEKIRTLSEHRGSSETRKRAKMFRKYGRA